MRPIEVRNPVLAKLLASANYGRLIELSEAGCIRRKIHGEDPVAVVWHAATRGAMGPTKTERMTRQERTNLAKSVKRSAAELGDSLKKLLRSEVPYRSQSILDGSAFDVPYQFQSGMDGFALDVANSYAETFEQPQRDELEENDTFHFARYAVYHLLREGLPELMEVLQESSEWWDSEEQYLAKPNHANADRLYFIRRATEVFYISYGQPMRELTLELTSIFFDCSDLAEADLSRLAPVRNIRSPFLRTAEQKAEDSESSAI